MSEREESPTDENIDTAHDQVLNDTSAGEEAAAALLTATARMLPDPSPENTLVTGTAVTTLILPQDSLPVPCATDSASTTPLLPQDSMPVPCETNTSLPTHGPSTASAADTPHYVVAEEYTIGVPLVRPKQEFLDILKKAGATGEVFTKKEICNYLKVYIGARQMYDPQDPRIVYCQNDPLGQIFGYKFTISDVPELLIKYCTRVPDTCIKRKRHLVARPLPSELMHQTTSQSPTSQPSSSSLTIQVCHASPVISSTTGPHTSSAQKRRSPKSTKAVGCTSVKTSGGELEVVCDKDNSSSKQSESGAKRRRRKQQKKEGSTVSSDSPSSRKRQASLSITYSDHDTEASNYPWYFRVQMETESESEILSVQDKETIPVQDSTDDLWFLDDSSISMSVEPDRFSVEYEVPSETSDRFSDTDLSSEISGGDVLVVCNDSDVPFWADSSGSESDTELSDADKWTCSECRTKNPPLQRYCYRCWKLRPEWLPDKLRKKSKTNSSRRIQRSLSAPGVISSSESSNNEPAQSSVLKNSKRKDSKPSNILEKQKEKRPVIGDTYKLPPRESKMNLESFDSGVFDLDVRHSFLNFQTVDQASGSVEGLKLTTVSETEGACEIQEKIPSRKPSVGDEAVEKTSDLQNPSKQNVQSLSSQRCQTQDMCIICLSKPKTGSIIHGNSGHQVCCYQCARRLKRRGKVCPVCRRPIQKVVKNFIL